MRLHVASSGRPRAAKGSRAPAPPARRARVAPDLYATPGVERPRSCACNRDAVDEASWYLGADDDGGCATATESAWDAAWDGGYDRVVDRAVDGVAAKGSEGVQPGDPGVTVTRGFTLQHTVQTDDGPVTHTHTIGDIDDWYPADPDGAGPTVSPAGTGGGGSGGAPDGPEDDEDTGVGARPPEGPPEGDDAGPKECTDPHAETLIDLFDVYGSAEDAVHVALDDGDGAVPEADDNASTDTSGDDDYGKGATGVEAPDHLSGPDPTGDDTGDMPSPWLAWLAPLSEELFTIEVVEAVAAGAGESGPSGWVVGGVLLGQAFAAGLGLYVRGELIDALSPTPYNDCDEFERCMARVDSPADWMDYCDSIYWNRLFPPSERWYRQCTGMVTPIGKTNLCNRAWNVRGLC